MNGIASDHRTAGVLSLLLLICLRSAHRWLENHVYGAHAKQYNVHQVQACDLCDPPNLPVETLDIRLPVFCATTAQAMPPVEEKPQPKHYYPQRGPPEYMAL